MISAAAPEIEVTDSASIAVVVLPLSVFKSAAFVLVSERVKRFVPLKSAFAVVVAFTPAKFRALAISPLNGSPPASSPGIPATASANSANPAPISAFPCPNASALAITCAPLSSCRALTKLRSAPTRQLHR